MRLRGLLREDRRPRLRPRERDLSRGGELELELELDSLVFGIGARNQKNKH